MEKRIVIIGAGPTGLGAAYRLKEIGYKNWAIFEKEDHVGGLSASVRDPEGFVWDKGGHVIFSHYKYFDDLMTRFLGNNYVEHERKAYIYCMDRWVPYPFQNNIRHLPKEALSECLAGLINARKEKTSSCNFKEWILNTFGDGIAKYFMIPQNSKTWAHPLEGMSKDWIADRISIIDVKRILENISHNRDDVSWGPNNKFKFPLHGGTGGLFERFQPLVSENLFLNKKVVKLDIDKKKCFFEDGTTDEYEILINTSPLDQLIAASGQGGKQIEDAASSLRHSGSLIVGVGLKGKCPSTKCWMYFPGKQFPFYRVTYFSNYSENNVPDSRKYWSLLCEVAYSEHKSVDKGTVIDSVISGLLAANLISKNDEDTIVSRYLMDLEYAYPTPTLGRDKTLETIMKFLTDKDIYSKGRFGSWRYEIGNMDHSVMQGVKTVDSITSYKEEAAFICPTN